MLSKDQYSVLEFLYDQKEVCVFSNNNKQISLLLDLADSLIEKNLIIGKSTTGGQTQDTFSITEEGKSAWENYTQSIKNEQFTRKLSIAAFVVSCVAVIVAIAGIIVSVIH